ncbi:unnamed protein product [Haemonchus placei]|uniref:Propanediol dehydratase n=1 Tax=Haemonchus placei TaxID=6290 RepID=A0A0N4VYR2_HAEPC|nr:unnamed protein product [Haemonchus placei]
MAASTNPQMIDIETGHPKMNVAATAIEQVSTAVVRMPRAQVTPLKNLRCVR